VLETDQRIVYPRSGYRNAVNNKVEICRQCRESHIDFIWENKRRGSSLNTTAVRSRKDDLEACVAAEVVSCRWNSKLAGSLTADRTNERVNVVIVME